jgi:ribonucleoside-triphosphate reductase
LSKNYGKEVKIMNSNQSILEELSKLIIAQKYARYRPELGRRETWEESVERVRDMHLTKFHGLPIEDLKKIVWAFDLVKQKKVVPSMRSMQFGGKAIEVNNARIYNCAVRHIDSIKSFSELFYLLLCGTGVGMGLSKYFLQRLPNIVSMEGLKEEEVTFTIPDTIEGWADSLTFLLDCYTEGNENSGKYPIFDYSLIRPKGAPLQTSGGKAPGPDGLRAAHEKIQQLLDFQVVTGQTRMRSIVAYDIMMHSADAVLSGGVRRSACCVVFDKDDEDMLNAKTGDWFGENPQRARSNNSVLLIRNEITHDEFVAIIKRTKEWGEPGFVMADHPWTLFNPCFEVGFIPVLCKGEVDYTTFVPDKMPELTDDIVCGVQMCNLSSMHGGKIKTVGDFQECVEAATIIGTLQAAYTSFPYLGATAEELTRSEALLGVSITGMLENPDILLDATTQNELAKYSTRVNEEWAAKLNINPATRCTVIKPEGTGSLALGTLFSGIHGAHSRNRQFRRIQANKEDNVYRFFHQFNPHLCEESVWSANKTDDVICFPIEVPEHAITKEDLTALMHLDIIRSTQENWVMGGISKANKKPVTHNVSCTVTVKEEEWPEVIEYVYRHKNNFSAISFVPDSSDKMYQQAPNEKVATPEDEARFNYLVEHFQPVDYTMLIETDDRTSLQRELACAGGKCELF